MFLHIAHGYKNQLPREGFRIIGILPLPGSENLNQAFFCPTDLRVKRNAVTNSMFFG